LGYGLFDWAEEAPLVFFMQSYVILKELQRVVSNTKYTRLLELNMSEEDARIGKTTTTQLEFGPPKYVATIPERARRILGATDDELEYEKGEEVEKVVVTAELTVEEVYTKDLGGDS
jgi:hypothetical protein